MKADNKAALLSWVKTEIDNALSIVQDNLSRQASANGDLSLATTCSTQLHQVSGALRIVGLSGATRFCEAIEHSFSGMKQGQAPGKSLMNAITFSVAALREFVDSLSRGGQDAPLKLYPAYSELSAAQGADNFSRKDLFFPDLTPEAPPHPAPTNVADVNLDSYVLSQRSRYQKGLLAWLRSDTDKTGLVEMVKAIDALYQIAPQLPEPRGLWWVAAGMLDGLMHPSDHDWLASTKPICGKLDLQIRNLTQSPRKSDDQLMRDMLYAVATCRPATRRMHEIRRIFQLNSLAPESDIPGLMEFDMDWLAPALDDIRSRITSIKDAWTSYISGDPGGLRLFRTQLAALKEKVQELGNQRLSQMLEVIVLVATRLPDPYPRQSQSVVMEMASAFLLLEHIVDNFTTLSDDVDDQIVIMGGWLIDAANNRSTGLPPAGLHADFGKKINEMRLQTQVACEILRNLQHIEQVLDEFSRNNEKRDQLPAISPLVRQIHGALVMLRFQRAADLLLICEKLIAECSNPAYPGVEEGMNCIAEGLSSLGFYLGPCLHGAKPAETAIDIFFERHEKRLADSRTEVSCESTEIGAADTPHTTIPCKLQAGSELADTPPRQEPPDQARADSGADSSELLGIYREEAGEVLASINSTLPLCMQHPHDLRSLAVIRRGFHTLKGSGRMVGLDELGDAAWQVERILNTHLERQQAASPALIDLLSTASESFSKWVRQLASPGKLHIDASHIVELAHKLEHDMESHPSENSVIQDSEITIGSLRLPRSLYESYVKEAHQHLAALRTEFEAWRNNPGTDGTHDFMRAAHTLASISRTSQFGAIADLSAALEQWLKKAHIPHTTDQIQAVAASIAKLQDMVDSVSRQEQASESSLVIQGLQSIIDELQPVQLVLSGESSNSSQSSAVTESPILAADEDRALIAAAAASGDERRLIKDDIDPTLLPVFLEEASDLLQGIGQDLRRWKAEPHLVDISQECKRRLHTFKGSARMTGAMRLGELSHLMESSIEEALETGAQPESALFEQLELQLDRLSSETEALQCKSESTAGAQPLRSVETEETAQPVEVPQAGSWQGTNATLRISADLLDELLNESGELGIARTRIEDELRVSKQSLLDLDDSVLRLRRQLREMEIQADSQMQSRVSVSDPEKRGFDPLEFDRFTRLQELTRMMAESLHDVATVQKILLGALSETDSALLYQARVNRHMHQSLMGMRTVPFSNLSERLYRIVRLSARELGKKVNLEIKGGQTGLDRGVLDRISAPVEHMLRNAVAHGIEKPEQRCATGKPEIGEITITLRQENEEVIVTVSDDGIGLNLEKLRAKAREMGMTQAQPGFSDTDVAQLIFTPGFSTSEEVTELSGRGIGMDVVQSEIIALGGRVALETVSGKGTTFTIHLPLTLAVTNAVIVRCAKDVFAIPSTAIEQVLKPKPEVLANYRESGVIALQQRSYPLHSLHHLLHGTHDAPAAEHSGPVLLLRDGARGIALYVDELLKNQEIIIKNIGPHLGRIQGITGATVLGDGRIALILNPVRLAQYTSDHAATPPTIVSPDKPAARLVMVVDDSLTVRKITGRLLEREGYRVMTAKDGIDALEKIRDTIPDLMLVDIEMPRMDGFDLSRNIRNDPRTAHLPIIIISSRTAEKHRSHAARIGVNAFLGKPYQEPELLEQVSRLATAEYRQVACN
jgi:chemosensory pili system protein ChpA (sensor histidine kinase/response regulator)